MVADTLGEGAGRVQAVDAPTSGVSWGIEETHEARAFG